MERKHEAYGVASLVRYLNTRERSLFGLRTKTKKYVTVRVAEAEISSLYGHDNIMNQGKVVEFTLSDAQLAGLLTGKEVPITFDFKDGHTVPEIPDPDLKREEELLTEAVKESVERAHKLLDDLTLAEENGRMTKTEIRTMISDVRKVIGGLKNDLPYQVAKAKKAITESLDEEAR